MRFDLGDEEWGAARTVAAEEGRSARVDGRKIVNAIFMCSELEYLGVICRHATVLYTTTYNRFNRWSRRGVWKRVFDRLASKSRDSLYLIDFTVVKALLRILASAPSAGNRCAYRWGTPIRVQAAETKILSQ